MKVKLEQIVVRRYKSGPREDELRPFDLPEGAQIVRVTFWGTAQTAIVTYVVPASGGST